MNNKCKKCTPLTKRILLGTLLGAIFGIICFAMFSSSPNIPAEMAKYQEWSWGNAMMWSTVLNRLVLGAMVGLAGFVSTHPMFRFKIPVFLRGIKMGALISLPMAFGTMIGEGATNQVFWMVLIAGTIIGMIIDLVITKISGDGEKLMSCYKNCDSE